MKKFFLLILFSYTLIASAQWVHQNSGTTGLLYDVFFPTKDTGYVSGTTPGILKTTNGGANWNVLPDTVVPGSLYFTSRDTGYATAYDVILKTVNGGISWVIQYSNPSLYGLGAIHFSDKVTGYTSGLSFNQDTMFFIKTTNGGNNWNIISYVTDPFFVAPLSGIDFVSRDTGFFTGNSRIYRTLNGCSTVTSVFSSAAFLNSIHFPTRDTGYAVGYPDALIKSINMGASWNVMSTPGNNEFYYDVFFTTKDTGFLAVNGGALSYGKILKTVNGGNNWVTQITDTSITALYFPTNSIGYAVGANGTILKHTGVVGIEENSGDQLVCYPNPTNGIFTLTTKAGSPKNIIIYNLNGQEIFRKEKLISEIIPIDISKHLSGIYFVIVTDLKGNRTTKKIVKAE